MNEFDRLGRSHVWRSAFRLSRALQPIFGTREGILQAVIRELPLVAGQAIFANSGFDRRVFLEELLFRARQIEEALYCYAGDQPLLRVWFRLDQLREAAFIEHDKVAEEGVEEFRLSQSA